MYSWSKISKGIYVSNSSVRAHAVRCTSKKWRWFCERMKVEGTHPTLKACKDDFLVHLHKFNLREAEQAQLELMNYVCRQDRKEHKLKDIVRQMNETVCDRYAEELAAGRQVCEFRYQSPAVQLMSKDRQTILQHCLIDTEKQIKEAMVSFDFWQAKDHSDGTVCPDTGCTICG